ncbi:restriction endonuclease subunit S [Marinobacter salarius]|uniref:EcoKI restriction-modification system protein HsdS n=1 Tax=Marinobacter salarius TaxID=1420917 RepID=A0A1W6K6R8_9GAMM|nr:restriction endonuclease subunit S [Marinobacter salarius]ARM83103.1 EcoKI restriction-modification system protein HsdS [Marinobacter salarius]MDP4533756.1 restriction endonuclease subunit S [Marinobacter salarius]
MAIDELLAEGLYPRGFKRENNWRWPLIQASKLVTLRYGKALKASERESGSVAVYGTNGQCGWHNEALQEGPGIILGRKGQGPLGVEWCETPFWVIDTAYYVDINSSNLDQRYFFYLVKYIGLNHLKDGTSNPSLSRSTFDKLLLPVPPKDEQKEIARLIRLFDEKVGINAQINTTLESMAQALFKSWFVDFDPVIDNALAAGNPIPEALQARADARAALGDRRKPLPDQIRQQFPDRFVLTEEMGWVPEGWKVTPLSEAIEINPKVTIKKGQKAKHVDMKALPTSGYCVGEISEKEYAGGAKFERGDVLLARITPCLENGKTGVVNFLSDGEPGFGSTEFIVMRPKNAIGTSFVAALARQEAFRQHCISNMVGSSGRQRVQNSCFDTYFICTPKVPDILDLYRDNCEAWFVKMTTLANESRSLGLLRDTLLPKLLSGELRIPEAEKQVEEII